MKFGFAGGTFGRVRSALLATTALCAIASPQMASGQTWTGATNNDWSTGTNWSTNAAPTAADPATMTGAGANQPVLTAASAANTLTMDGSVVPAGNTLNLNAQTLTLTTGLTMSAGSIVGAGSVTTAGTYSLSGGAISSTLAGAGSATVTGGSVNLAGANTFTGWS